MLPRDKDATSGESDNTLAGTPSPCSHVLILGLGNPLLGDDGVGWRVAQEFAARYPPTYDTPYEIDYHAGGGLTLMERLIGYTDAIIIDALQTGRVPLGTVQCFSLNELPNDAASHLASAHETNLMTALEVGRRMGADLPRRIMIVGIEAQQVYDFSEELSPAIAAATNAAEQLVYAQLRRFTHSAGNGGQNIICCVNSPA